MLGNLLFWHCFKWATDTFIWIVKALLSPGVWQLVLEANSDLVPLEGLGSLLGEVMGEKKLWEAGSWLPSLRSSVKAEVLTLGPCSWPWVSLIWILVLTCRLDFLAWPLLCLTVTDLSGELDLGYCHRTCSALWFFGALVLYPLAVRLLPCQPGSHPGLPAPPLLLPETGVVTTVCSAINFVAEKTVWCHAIAKWQNGWGKNNLWDSVSYSLIVVLLPILNPILPK